MVRSSTKNANGLVAQSWLDEAKESHKSKMALALDVGLEAEPRQPVTLDSAEQALAELQALIRDTWEDAERAWKVVDPLREGQASITSLHAVLRRRGYRR